MKDINKKRFSLFLGSALALSSVAFPFSIKTDTASAEVMQVQKTGVTSFFHYWDSLTVNNCFEDHGNLFYPVSYPVVKWIPTWEVMQGAHFDLPLAPQNRNGPESSYSSFYAISTVDSDLYDLQQFDFEDVLGLSFQSPQTCLFEFSLADKAIPLSYLQSFFESSFLSVSFDVPISRYYLKASFDILAWTPINNEISRVSSSVESPWINVNSSNFSLFDGLLSLGVLGSLYDDLSSYPLEPTGDYLYFSSLTFGLYVDESNDGYNLSISFNGSYDYYLPSTIVNYNSLALDFFLDEVVYVDGSPARSIWRFVEEFFSFEIVPGFSFGLLIILGIAGLMLGFTMKLFLGG